MNDDSLVKRALKLCPVQGCVHFLFGKGVSTLQFSLLFLKIFGFVSALCDILNPVQPRTFLVKEGSDEELQYFCFCCQL